MNAKVSKYEYTQEEKTQKRKEDHNMFSFYLAHLFFAKAWIPIAPIIKLDADHLHVQTTE
jgi:hypothetical protein